MTPLFSVPLTSPSSPPPSSIPPLHHGARDANGITPGPGAQYYNSFGVISCGAVGGLVGGNVLHEEYCADVVTLDVEGVDAGTGLCLV